MSEVKWIKLATDIFDNRKIRQIEKMPDGDAIIVIWLKLLILAGDVNDGGLVYFTREIAYTDQLLATHFDRPLATVQFALNTFVKFGMIEIVDNLICISNWEKYQNVESLDRIREQNRIRKQRQRDREKLLPSHVTSRDSHATDIEEDKEKEGDEERDSKKRKRFTPPTLEEVKAYVAERKSSVDPVKFFDYYSYGDWHDSKGHPVRNWKQKLLTWEKSDSPMRKITTDEEYSKMPGPKVDIDKLKGILESMGGEM